MYVRAEFQTEKCNGWWEKWRKACKEPTSPFVYYFAGVDNKYENNIHACYAVKDAQAWIQFRNDVFKPLVKECGIKLGKDLIADHYISGPKESLDLIRKDIGDNKTYHYYEEHGPSNGFSRLNVQDSAMTKPFVIATDWTFIIPFMNVNDLNKAEPLASEIAKLVKDNEPGCLYYGFSHDVEGNKFHCREVYTDPKYLLEHLKNVGGVLGKMMGDDKPMSLAGPPVIFTSGSHGMQIKEELSGDVPKMSEYASFKDAFVREGLV